MLGYSAWSLIVLLMAAHGPGGHDRGALVFEQWQPQTNHIRGSAPWRERCVERRSTVNTSDETKQPDAQLGRVKLIYSHDAEVYVDRNPLSFLYPPVEADYDRKRTVEIYMLLEGLKVTVYDGFSVQSFVVTLGVEGEIKMRAA